MAVKGDLSTMPLPELLQWLGGNGKTGNLEVEREKVCKQILFSQGTVIAAASNDPKELLGHFLVSRGQITEELLGIALEHQESTGKPLGTTLVEMGVLSTDDLIRNLSGKAEETIFSLFDWEDAVFRYEDTLTAEDPPFPICIRVEDILLRGVQRIDEVNRIRGVFNDPGIVPQRTNKLPPPEVFRNRMARRIYESINGERTVADIILHAHGSQYLVTKFLFELHRTGLVVIRETRAIPEVEHPKVSNEIEEELLLLPGTEMPEPLVDPAPAAGESAPEPPPPAPAPDPEPAADLPEPLVPDDAGPQLEQQLVHASTLMGQGDYDGALDILDGLYREQPNNGSLRRLTREAEKAFTDKAYRHYLPPTKVPVLVQEIDSLMSEDLSPQEFFLLSRLDGSWNVKSIIHISPIREVEALRMLKKMVGKGVIELREAEGQSQAG